VSDRFISIGRRLYLTNLVGRSSDCGDVPRKGLLGLPTENKPFE
jgi:hypothetical protein